MEEEWRPSEAAPEEKVVLDKEAVSAEIVEQPPLNEEIPEEVTIEGIVTQENSPSSDITHRLAEEFFLLREEFPAIERPEQLPDAVLDIAADKSVSLLDAYLRFCHEENKRILHEEECRRQAAERSTGSLRQGTTDAHPEQDAFLRAFRKALK